METLGNPYSIYPVWTGSDREMEREIERGKERETATWRHLFGSAEGLAEDDT